jgi:hypothetical protein
VVISEAFKSVIPEPSPTKVFTDIVEGNLALSKVPEAR